MPWIHHPATQDGPVSVRRWLLYHIGTYLYEWGMRLEYRALHGTSRARYDDELPF